MPPWVTRTTRICLTFAIATGCLATTTAAAPSTPPATPPSAPEETTPESAALATAESNGENDDITEATAEVIDVTRSQESNLASLTLRVTNNGTENLHDNYFESEEYLYYAEVFSGVTLSANGQQVHPVMDAETHCLCSGYASREPYAAFIKPNQSIDFWALYSLPEGSQSVTVEIPGFDAMENVPVG